MQVGDLLYDLQYRPMLLLLPSCLIYKDAADYADSSACMSRKVLLVFFHHLPDTDLLHHV